MTQPFDPSQHPRGTGGRFARTVRAEMDDIDLTPSVADAQAELDAADADLAAAQSRRDAAIANLTLARSGAGPAAGTGQQWPALSSIPDNEPVDVNHPEIQAGAVRDVVVSGGTTYHRVRDGHFGAEPYSMRVQFDRDVSDEEIQRSAQLMGYALATAGQREGASDPERDSPRSFTLSVDTTKGRSYRHLDEFEDNLNTYLSEGTPVRKTDRSGPGTAGTRLVDGLGDKAPSYQLYYDSIYDPDMNRHS